MENSKLSTIIKWVVAALLIVIGIAAIAVMVTLKAQKAEINSSVYYWVIIPASILIFIGAMLGYTLLTHKGIFRPLTIGEISMVGIQSAITVVLYYFAKFSLPFFPGWLDVQVSEIPALITTFAYGPYAGSMVILVRFLTKLPATITAGVGELSDLILGLILVIVSGNIYTKHHTLKGGLVGIAIGMGVATVTACFTNWLILIPAYTTLAGIPLMGLVSMLDKIYPFEVTQQNFMASYIFIGVIPFNLFRYVIVFALTAVLYKRTHMVLNYFTRKKSLGKY